MTHYGLFNDESADWTEDEAVEAGFYSRSDAEIAIRERYSEEDELTIHEIEEPEDGEEETDDESDEDGAEALEESEAE